MTNRIQFWNHPTQPTRRWELPRRRPSALGMLSLAAVLTMSTVLAPASTALGLGGRNQVTEPGAVGSPDVAKDRLDIGARATCAALGSGQVACAGQHPIPDGNVANFTARVYTTPAVDAAGMGAGDGVACARKGSGAVTCWGDAGASGTGASNAVSNATTQVIGVTDAVEVDTGYYDGCARRSGATVRCWGRGQEGQRGDGTTAQIVGSSNVLDVATGLPLANVRQIGMSNFYNCALISDGSVKCWGQNRSVFAGNPLGSVTQATTLPGLTSVSSIDLGDDQGCAVISDGTVKCFGNLTSANFPGSGTSATTPKTIVGVANTRMVGAGRQHACALLTDTTVTCWGKGDNGQLGRVSGAGIFAPQAVPGLIGVRSVHSGGNNTCVVLIDGTVKCWGQNDAGQLGLAGTNISTPTDVPQFSWGGRFTPLTPARILDTRSGAKPTGGSSTTVIVRGQGGVPATANGVLVNITAVNPDTDGYVSVYPCTPTPPNSSNLNYSAGESIPNLVAAPLTADGKICLFTSAGAHLLADVAGYYDSTGSAFTGLTPQRILDTRTGQGAPAGKLASNGRIDLQVLGAATGVPANATGIVLNVTAVDVNGGGYVTVFPCSPTAPNASNLNFNTQGQTIANLVAMPLAAGKVCFFTSQGAHLLADVAGYFGPDGPAFAPVDPNRVLDTRTGIGAPAAKLGAGQTLTLHVRGVAGGAPANAETVVLNITAVDPSAGGYLTVFPCGTQPQASNLNFVTGRNIPNLVMMPVSSSGDVCIFTSAATHILADLNGHYRMQ